MFKYIKKNLHLKILSLVIGIITAGVLLSIFIELKNRETELLEEKIRASRFLAQPVLQAIYQDMLAERADMARHLVKALTDLHGTEIKIIRSNGTEEAFKDFKTIKNVRKTHGAIHKEWADGHPDEPINIAIGTNTAEFKKAFEGFSKNWGMGSVYYVEKSGPAKTAVLTYLHPIEKKAECASCHAEEGARGILMVRTPLAEMYSELAITRNQWMLSGGIAILIGSALLSLLISSAITGPIKKNVAVIKKITEGKGGYHARVQVRSEDEIGYMATAFNNMLDALQKRDDDNKRLFEMVARSKEEWVDTFDAIGDLISILDRDFNVLKVNRALADKLGQNPENLIGRRCCEVFFNKNVPIESCPHAATISSNTITTAEVNDFVFEGTYNVTTFPIFDDSGKIWATVHVARDITNEKLLREQLFHSEKLSSVGKLVAGIAHELNNPLMGILGFSQILMDMPGDKKLDDIKDKLKKIYQESLRTARIVQNLLTFARSQKTKREYTDINDIIRRTLDLKEYSLGANKIKTAFELAPNLPNTMADPYQLQQVFINIINNAEDAMADYNKSGRLEIKTRKNRDKILITFKDDGPGIPKNILKKVFDPFFTTKEVGKGTGLGLSITHGIVTEHGGSIDITVPDAGGALVTIELPIIEKEQWTELKKAIDIETALTSEEKQVGKRILVVDDEITIREALTEFLTRAGFVVTAAGTGKEGAELIEKNGFSLVIADIKMPDINGMELYDIAVNKSPALKESVIIITGAVLNPEIKNFVERTKCPLVLKPFTMTSLLKVIRDMPLK